MATAEDDVKDLEALITSKLSSLQLEQDTEETTTFVLGIVQEDSFEREDKKSAILGYLEKDEDDEAGVSIDELLDQATELQDRVRAKEKEDEERRKGEKATAEASKLAKKVLTPEEEAARKQELIQSYGYVEEEDEAELAAAAEANKVPSAVFVDPKLLTKKARKKAEQGVDILMQPNLNSAIVKGAELQRRREDAAKSAAKKEKDKSDLKKQKEDAAKKLLEKQKKAQKGERKA